MTRKLETEYRLRWRRTGTHHRTRYYSRKHFAVKAAERYKAGGYEVELHERSIVVFDDWAAVSEWEPAAGVAVSLGAKATSTCRVCGKRITEVEPSVWCTKGEYGGVCKDNRPMLHHVPR